MSSPLSFRTRDRDSNEGSVVDFRLLSISGYAKRINTGAKADDLQRVAGAGQDGPASGMLPGPLPSDDVTLDHLLGGRVAYMQPRDGFRAAIDPVLLAAAVPARAGDRVLEGGTGAGAALLCLAARVPDIFGLGVDRDPGLLLLAQANAAANARPELLFAAGDLAASPIGGEFDHAFANPPYHATDGTPSPSHARDAAKRSSPGQLSVWVEALSRPLRHRGTLTIILPPQLLEAALKAMRDSKAPAECVFPVWPRQGRPARLLLVQGRKHGRAPLTLAPGLVLHAETGAFRPETDLVLRAGGALRLTGA
jgi:tRNA1Val (adenine37-N6)-methyltransferase